MKRRMADQACSLSSVAHGIIPGQGRRQKLWERGGGEGGVDHLKHSIVDNIESVLYKQYVYTFLHRGEDSQPPRFHL